MYLPRTGHLVKMFDSHVKFAMTEVKEAQSDCELAWRRYHDYCTTERANQKTMKALWSDAKAYSAVLNVKTELLENEKLRLEKVMHLYDTTISALRELYIATKDNDDIHYVVELMSQYGVCHICDEKMGKEPSVCERCAHATCYRCTKIMLKDTACYACPACRKTCYRFY